eukprot:12403408-Karenia_brevis.AAC.1
MAVTILAQDICACRPPFDPMPFGACAGCNKKVLLEDCDSKYRCSACQSIALFNGIKNMVPLHVVSQACLHDAP